MKTVVADEVETRFRELLADVAKGETITVTEEDEPVAQIVPVRKAYTSAAEAIDDWRRYRRERNLTLGEGLTIRELIEEGRECRSAFSTLRSLSRGHLKTKPQRMPMK